MTSGQAPGPKGGHYRDALSAALLRGGWADDWPGTAPNGNPLSWGELIRKWGKHTGGSESLFWSLVILQPSKKGAGVEHGGNCKLCITMGLIPQTLSWSTIFETYPFSTYQNHIPSRPRDISSPSRRLHRRPNPNPSRNPRWTNPRQLV
jgi:hypothetical protein